MASTPDPENLPSLERLQTQIDAVKRDTRLDDEPQEPERYDRFSPAARLGIEMVAGAVVGIVIGYLIDEWQGTNPWFTIGFFFLGCAAGFRNIKRLS